MESLERRLLHAGQHQLSSCRNFEFVLDKEGDDNNKKKDGVVDGVQHVKTLVWEAIVHTTFSEEENHFYFVTATRHHDRVDQDKLQQQLVTQQQQNLLRMKGTATDEEQQQVQQEVISLKLAETWQAEQLTGYMSGTIPPMGHTTPLVLFVDKALLLASQNNIRFLSMGSGSFRHSLHLGPDDFLQHAKILSASVVVASIAQLSTLSLSGIPAQEDQDSVSVLEEAQDDSPTTTTTSAATATTAGALPVSDEIKALVRLLRDAALQKGRSNRSNIIRTVISQASDYDRFSELFQLGTEVNYSRHAMHLVAWKGDLESIRLLLDAAQKYPDLDLVNSISIGDGNYGKTPIFYAINQRRDAVVRLLLEHGANLLIVNRNGYTPCSLAIGRLQPGTIDLLKSVEAQQLQASGGTYTNYTTTTTATTMMDTTCKSRGSTVVATTEENSLVAASDRATELRESIGLKSAATITASVSLKSLSKRLRDAAGKAGKSDTVRDIIQESGDDFLKLVEVGTDGNFTKNALHLAAWKGDSESVHQLIDAGIRCGMDLVNVISRGEGNYGKTPIFYAITQDRDDIVKLLLERGANLLIVNNKGQTPCSMSVTHLRPETCQAMFDKEYEQIQEAGEFVIYRITHSDNKQYGDLDPRFEIDQYNYGQDIVDQLADFRKTVEATKKDCKDATAKPLYKLLPASFQPRSIRPTTRELRKIRADKFRLKDSVCAKKIQHSKLPRARDVIGDDAAEEKKVSDIVKSELGSGTEDNENDNIEQSVGLSQLHLNDLYSAEPDTMVINKQSQLSMLLDEVLLTLDHYEKEKDSSMARGQARDSLLMELSWGLDCEWKPSRTRGSEYPVATLQLASCRRSFLVDLQELCQSSIKVPDNELTETERVLNGILIQLFINPSVPILGFGIGGDLAKLAVSFPHMPCFREHRAVVDLASLFHNAFPQSCQDSLRSLQKSVSYLLRKHMDKTEQCSNWQKRPLTLSQVEYASLDAAVLPFLLKAALKQFPTSGFFLKHPHLLVSWKVTFLDHHHVESSISPRLAYDVENGTVRSMLSMWYAKQSWQTGKEEPAQPTLIPFELQLKAQELREEKEVRKADSKQTAKAQRKAKRKKQALKLSTISIGALPDAGQFLGYTKEACILEFLGQSTLDSLDEDFYLAFNRRGGIIQMRDAWLLFVNFGGATQNRKFQNKFSGGGRFITFTVDPRKDLDGEMYDYLSLGCEQQLDGSQTTSLRTEPEQPRSQNRSYKLLLFARPDNSSEYLFCGNCDCVGEEASLGGIDLLLELKDFDTLENSAYLAMIQNHSG